MIRVIPLENPGSQAQVEYAPENTSLAAWERHATPHIYTFSTCNVCYKAWEWVRGVNADFICSIGVLKRGGGRQEGGVLEELGVGGNKGRKSGISGW